MQSPSFEGFFYLNTSPLRGTAAHLLKEEGIHFAYSINFIFIMNTPSPFGMSSTATQGDEGFNLFRYNPLTSSMLYFYV